jgi:hypothetical protein
MLDAPLLDQDVPLFVRQEAVQQRSGASSTLPMASRGAGHEYFYWTAAAAGSTAYITTSSLLATWQY